MPILACQLPAHHHLGKHVHRALSDQLHPWVGARHVPQLLSGLLGPLSLCAHPISCPSSLLELSAAEEPALQLATTPTAETLSSPLFSHL